MIQLMRQSWCLPTVWRKRKLRETMSPAISLFQQPKFAFRQCVRVGIQPSVYQLMPSVISVVLKL